MSTKYVISSRNIHDLKNVSAAILSVIELITLPKIVVDIIQESAKEIDMVVADALQGQTEQ